MLKYRGISRPLLQRPWTKHSNSSSSGSSNNISRTRRARPCPAEAKQPRVSPAPRPAAATERTDEFRAWAQLVALSIPTVAAGHRATPIMEPRRVGSSVAHRVIAGGSGALYCSSSFYVRYYGRKRKITPDPEPPQGGRKTKPTFLFYFKF